MDKKAVITLVFEFILTLVILIGGGFMLYFGADKSSAALAGSAIGMVLNYWFLQRDRERQSKKAAQKEGNINGQ